MYINNHFPCILEGDDYNSEGGGALREAKVAFDLKGLLFVFLSHYQTPEREVIVFHTWDGLGAEEIFGPEMEGLEELARCGLDRILPVDMGEDPDGRACLQRMALARQGLLVPLHGPAGQAGMMLALADDDDAAWQARQREMVARLHHFAAGFFERHFILPHRKRAASLNLLSRREAECLFWCAQGKSYWETSRILGISERTVNHHMKMVREKLGVQTNAQAVWHASVHGLFARFSVFSSDD